MAKQKYYYTVVDKDNGRFLLDEGRLPIFYRQGVANGLADRFKGYIVHKINIEALEKLVISTPKQ